MKPKISYDDMIQNRKLEEFTDKKEKKKLEEKSHE
jgi:hypothetical protein